ncbi:MAG: hypothetical protein M1296_03895 [Chloroflexi bacterium]|nr:hypothetical protein [Chloroflexota bacterium]
MLRRAVHCCVVALVCAFTLGAPVLADPLSVIPRSVTGDPRLGVAESFTDPAAAWTLGARWERVVFQWSSIQPNGPSDWVPSTNPTIAQLDADHARGVSITGLLINTPGWAQSNQAAGVHSPPSGLNLPINDPGNSWAQFCVHMAQSYGNDVSSWVIWNEPDVWDPASPFYTWAGDPATYYQLLKVADEAIKSVQPSATIVFAGMTFYWDANAGRPQFLSQVLDVAASDPTAAAHGDYFDVVAAHVYTTVTNAYWVPKTFSAILTAHGLSKPIWIDETNVPPYNDPASQLPPGAPNATLSQQADFLLEVYAEALAADVQRIEVYKMKDVVPQDGAPYGLERNDGTFRPAYAAIQTAVQYLGSYASGDLRTGQHHIAIAFSQGDTLTTVAWNTGPYPYTLMLCAHSQSATLVNTLGQTSAITPVGPGSGVYTVPLAPATAHGIFNGRDMYYIGGSPVIIQEQHANLSESCAPPVLHDNRYFAQTGYRINTDSFWTYFQARGGVSTFGYPVSRTFEFMGFPTQIFQRQVMQLQPNGSVQLLNLLDPGLLPYAQFNGSIFPSADPALEKAAPSPASPTYAQDVISFVQAHAPDAWQGQPVNFYQTFTHTVSLKQAFQNGQGNPALLPLLNLEVWGLPTSEPVVDATNHNFIYLRFQRGVMQFDASCQCTHGILFGDYLKEVLTNQRVPADLASEALASKLFRQYDPDSAGYLDRPWDLPATDLTFAFIPG